MIRHRAYALQSALVLLPACLDRFDVADNQASSGETASNSTESASTAAAAGTTGQCEPGTEGCACVDMMCDGGLVCVASTCVLPPDETGGSPPPTSGETNDTNGMTTTGLPECSGVLSCEPGFVCVNAMCSHAWNHSFELRVLEFWAPCPKGTELSASYYVWRDEDVIANGPANGCPGMWPEIATLIEPFSRVSTNYVVDFWDTDGTQPVERLCAWNWGGPIPAEVLAEGLYTGTFDGGCYAELEFTVVE